MLDVSNEYDFNVANGFYAVKFGAEWCSPCKIMDKTLEKLETEFDNYKFLSIDVDQVPTLAREYKIKTVPTVLLFSDGKEVERISGSSLIEPIRHILRTVSSIK